jgi:hypothetical protein
MAPRSGRCGLRSRTSLNTRISFTLAVRTHSSCSTEMAHSRIAGASISDSQSCDVYAIDIFKRCYS